MCIELRFDVNIYISAVTFCEFSQAQNKKGAQ